MGQYPISKIFKKTFIYNGNILNDLEMKLGKEIHFQSNLDLQKYLYSKLSHLMPQSYQNWRGDIKTIIKNVANCLKYSPIPLKETKIIGLVVKYDFTTLYNSIKYLEKQYNNLEINFNNKTIDYLIKDIEYNYNLSGIDKIITEYNNFIESLNIEIENIMNAEISILKSNKKNNDSDVEYYKQISEIIENYSKTYLNEIKRYVDKLKVFGMIDGLNYIKLEKIGELKDIWNFSLSSNHRNLDNSKGGRKFLNIQKLFEYHKSLDKTNKLEILSKMKNIMENNSVLRNLDEEYNTRDKFNSTSDPIILSNISNMVENLNDDINNFIKIIITEEIKSKYELIKLNLEVYDKVLHSMNICLRKIYLKYICLNLQMN